ncbi:MAG: HAMP domain-containing histidine kinase, partial [Deltaproteobacteria bacterium]|nr:HAMP domain-containing histidine kinase [Deltaproteobacteria bacterium]
DRYQLLRLEKEAAQAHLLDSLRRENETREKYSHRLEADVKQRTVELNFALEEVHKINASKDKFFSIIAHDLKNPFSSLIATSEVLATSLKDLHPDEAQEFAGRIHSTSIRGYTLLENLLQWAMIQMGKVDPIPETFLLDKALLPELELLGDMAMAKDIRLTSDIPDGMNVVADKNMTRTVVRNLVSNAIKFTHPGRTIQVGAAAVNGHMAVSVTDQGVGIKPEDIPRLFAVGGNVRSQGTAKETGTGLGLMICKEMVELNGGTLNVTSKLGEGTTITLTLPKSQPGAADMTEKKIFLR